MPPEQGSQAFRVIVGRADLRRNEALTSIETGIGEAKEDQTEDGRADAFRPPARGLTSVEAGENVKLAKATTKGVSSSPRRWLDIVAAFGVSLGPQI